MAQLLRSTYQLSLPGIICVASAAHLDSGAPSEVRERPLLLGLAAGDQQQAVAQAPHRTPMADYAICRQPPKVGAVCVNAHVRICAGGAGQPAFLPRSLATERLKRSGMRWREAGGQAILTLRGWAQSDRFSAAWSLLSKTYWKEVSVPDDVAPLTLSPKSPSQ